MCKKRVLHIIPGFGGGISSLVRTIIINSDPDRIINDVVGFNQYPDFFQNEVQNKGGQTFTLPSVHKIGKRKCSKLFISILKRNSYDAVHIHVSKSQFLFFAVLCKMAGVNRIIAHAHSASYDDSNTFPNKVAMIFWRMVESVLADQYASCSKMASEFIFGKRLVKKNKIMHIPNGVNIERFCHVLSNNEIIELRKSLGISVDTFIVGHVGNFRHQKNHEFMLEIISLMKKQHKNFKWLFIGEGSNMEKTMNMATEMEIDDCILFLGRRNDVSQLFQIMNVFVLPSHYEGLPTVSVESQASGTPVVMSDTITNEVDLKLNMTKYLSLNQPIDNWVNAIYEMACIKKVSIEERIQRLNELLFTSEKVAKLYEDFIYGYINYYNIGEEYSFHNS